MKKILKYFLLFALLICFNFPQTVFNDLPVTVSADTISPQSDTIGWIYSTIGGKRYKRLYNYTTGEWIGDWILVG